MGAVRRVRRSLAGAVLVIAGLAPASAGADPVDEFDACLTSATAAECGDNVTYYFGDVVILKGTVSPVHDAAVVQLKAPGTHRWKQIDTVSISDAGRMKWRWRTHRIDADQGHAYHLRFRIPGHGVSDAVEAWVLFGE
jgi:hypothetical protein